MTDGSSEKPAHEMLELAVGNAYTADHSIIDPRTISAYVETDYIVYARSCLRLRIGQAHAGLANLHTQYGVTCSAFLTAWNPFGSLSSDQENSARQNALVHHIGAVGLAALPGFGKLPSSRWPPEQSFLVMGLGRVAAIAMGTRFEQNAIVWCSNNAVPELVLLR